MSEADRAKWSRIYGAPDPERTDPGPGVPEPFVEAAVRALGPGDGRRALDLAGGLGRHALLLAERGFSTVLADIAPEGLERAEAAARARGLEIGTVALDLDRAWAPLDASAPFEVVVVAWFRLTEPMWAELCSRLSLGGRLVLVHPTRTNLERHPRPSARWLAEPGAVAAEAARAGLVLVRAEEGWDQRGHHTARILAVEPER